MRVLKSARVLIVLLAAALTACGGNSKPSPADGGIKITVAAITGGPQVVLVRLYGPTTTQPGVPPTIDTVVAAQTVAGSGVFTASFPTVPAGTYQVHAKGYNAFDVLPAAYNDPATPPIWESASSDPSVVVTGGSTSSVSLFMQEIGVPEFSNNAPWVSAMAADVSSVYSSTNGGTATSANLTASILDADGDLTGFAWFDDVNGTFGTASGTFSPMVGTANIATTWTPPPNFAGTAHLALEVYDSIFNASRVVMTMTVIQTPGYGAVLVDVSFNNNPMMASPLVANFLVDPVSGAILGGGGQIAAGAQTLLTVSAFDPNGDNLQFTFTDDCGGSFGAPTITGTGSSADPFFAEVLYTAPATAPASATCVATADIRDFDAITGTAKGGELLVHLGIHVGLP